MLIEIGILWATYTGIRLLEKMAKKNPEKKAKRSAKHQTELIPQRPSDEEETTLLPVRSPEHYSKVSLAAMGLFALRGFCPPLKLLGLGSYIYGMIPYMRDVEKAIIRDRKLNVDVLFFTADMLTLAVNQYFTAGAGLYLIHAGKMAVAKAKDESEKNVTGIFDQLPQNVWVLVDGQEIEVPLKSVKRNDILVVGTGEVVPVDGDIRSGMASIDQRALTGESQPAEKGPGERVFANTLIITGQIHIQVLESGAETTASKITEILFQSSGFKSKTQLKGELWADTATVPTMVGAALALPTLGPVAAAVLINSHIGNRIRLFAPMATLQHITLAAQEGVLAKDGRALERLYEVDTVLFDKTGTLTTDEPEVTRILAQAPWSETEILRLAALAEGKLKHPIAQAIVKRAQQEGCDLSGAGQTQYQVGYGITLNLDGHRIRVGSIRFHKGMEIPAEMNEHLTAVQEQGHSMILVAIDSKVAGAIELQPQIRPEAKAMIQQLRAMGIRHLAIVSGDHEAPTRKLAFELGVDEHFANTLPDHKADIVANLQAQGRKVCFVGDGINDTIAMEKADVSVSFSGANTIASDVAEIILLDGTLKNLIFVFKIAKKLDKNLKKTLKLTVAPGLINLTGAVVFQFGILTSLLVNTGFGTIVMLSVMRPLKPEE